MSQESEFYKELDKTHKTEKEKTLSAWSLTVFFIVFILIAEGLIFYLGRNLRVGVDGDLTGSKIIEGLNLVSQPVDVGGPVYVPEGVLCSQVASVIKNELKCSITEENVVLNGKVSALLPSNASAYFVPNNGTNKGKLELNEVKIGKISTFKFIGAPLNSVLDKAIMASVGSNVKIKKIDLERGIMVLTIDR